VADQSPAKDGLVPNRPDHPPLAVRGRFPLVAWLGRNTSTLLDFALHSSPENTHGHATQGSRRPVHVYYAEKQFLKTLPKMAKAAKSPELKQAFETHRDETEGHVERLTKVFEIIGKAPRGKTCDAILGTIEEGKAVIEEYSDSPALDDGLAASAQAVEHYEISGYGTLRAWAD